MKVLLNIDCVKEAERIQRFIKEQVYTRFKHRGFVVGLSGGIDSALICALGVEALGKDKVLGLILPEKESNPISLEYAVKHAASLGIKADVLDITGQLEALGAYQERNAVIRKLFPEYNDDCKFHITLPQNLLEKDRLNYHIITVQSPQGTTRSRRLSPGEWQQIAAAQNTKQRIRMVNLYRLAERHNYVVAGTTNKSEVMQGFCVKYGDGGVDIEPIAHLYKVQVYQLARHLGVIEEIINRPPSPDTYSLPVTDEQFYFCMPYELADLLMYAYEHDIPQREVSEATQLKAEQIQRAFRDFKAKENATWHLRQMPPTVDAGFRIM